MTATLALAVGIPLALGAICLASRRSRPLVTADARGIALQTVIVIVVMLVIAGGVSGVLLSRGGDVISDLESADVSGSEVNTLDECTDAYRALTKATNTAGSSAVTGNNDMAAAQWDQNSSTCTIRDDQRNTLANTFSRNACELYRGSSGSRASYTDGTGSGSTSSYCTIS